MVIQINAGSCGREPIDLGKVFENNARQIVFDLSELIEEYGPGTAVLAHRRSQDWAPYLANTTQDGNLLTWDIEEVDVTYTGRGEAELIYTVDDIVAKSVTFTTVTRPAVSGTGDVTVPPAIESWYNAMIEYINNHCATSDDIAAAVEAYLIEHPVGDTTYTISNQGRTITLTPSVGAPQVITIPDTDLTGYATESWVESKGYLTEHQSLSGYAKESWVTGKGYQTAGQVQTAIAGKANSADLAAVATSGSYNDLTNKPTIPAAVTIDATLSQTGQAADAKATGDALALKGTYSKPSGGIPKSDLASAVRTSLGKADSALQTAPVTSVNTKTGAVVLGASDVGALPDDTTYVSSVNGSSGAVTVTVPTKTSDLTNDSGFAPTYYGVSSTAAGTQTKTVTISGITELTTGLHIYVLMQNASNYGGPKLNVNSLGAKDIMVTSSTSARLYEWEAGTLLDLVYNGTAWMLTRGPIATTTYYGVTKLYGGYNSNSNTMAATAGALKSAYDTLNNSKASTAVATTSAAGLMSATDKANLDAVVADYSAALNALGVS